MSTRRSDDIRTVVRLNKFFPFPTDPSVHHRQKTLVTDMCYPTEISSLMDFGTPDCSLGKGTLFLQITRCCLGDSRKWAWWFILAVKKRLSCQFDWRVNTEARAIRQQHLPSYEASVVTADFDISHLNNTFLIQSIILLVRFTDNSLLNCCVLQFGRSWSFSYCLLCSNHIDQHAFIAQKVLIIPSIDFPLCCFIFKNSIHFFLSEEISNCC